MAHLHSTKNSFNSEKLFFRFFPVPKFLLMESVGVDISDNSIRFVEMVSKSGVMSVGRFGEQIIPEGVVSSGEIKDPATLKTALIGLRRDHNLSFVRASLPEQKAFLFRLEVPILSAAETRENISFSLEEHVPIKAMDSLFDYVFVEPLFGKVSPGMREVVVSVYPQEVVQQYIDVYEGAGLTLMSLEMEGAALGRSVIRKGDLGTYMIVDFGAKKTGISVASRGAVHFTTTVDVGGDKITSAIEKELGVSHEEAEKLKREGSFGRQGINNRLMPALLESISELKDQINKHYIYWHNHPDKKDETVPTIEKIILCGGDANLEGVAEHFGMVLHTKVELANVWVNSFKTENYIPPISFAESLSYATAVGLALPTM